MNKVLLLSHMPPPTTGIGSWTVKLMKHGLGGNWSIDLVNTNTINGRDPFKNEKRNIKDEWKRCSSIWGQEKKLLQGDPQGTLKVVHTCIPCTLFGMLREIVSGKIAHRYNRKFILHCRCTVPNVVNSRLKKLVFKKLAMLCDGIIVLNEKSKTFVEPFTKGKVVLIPNFAERYTVEASAQKERTFEKFTDLVFVGGVTKDKGCDLIIDAAKELPDVKFHLIGIIKDEIDTNEATPNVIFYGNRENSFVKDFLKNADGFLFLSHYWGEGFSNALVEAMAAGLPCIVTDWAANADMIENKGGIVIPHDSEELVKAVKLLSSDKHKREQASEFNKEKVLSTYVDDVVIPQYVKFYEELLG